ncbi:unnamed protein product [Brassicogethes aeneus]|uniref:Uncharacterized protein n=1 Tax=Brassicogethes aeneus TaxID=1431903 RepID=A0A9P0B8A0_BRAAE|nr:unnamed protein product [Brassicogethes aeneus]
MKVFFDLCVSDILVCPQNCKDTIKTLYDYGYRTIAINHSYEKDTNDAVERKNKNKKAGQNTEFLPAPLDLTYIENIKKEFGIQDLKVLNRLTIPFANQDVLHKIVKSDNYKKYDIVAVNPKSASAFAFCCSTFEADILALDPGNKQNYKINRKTYNLLIERGYHFELIYSSAIEDQTKRKNLIHVAHLYHSFGKSKNIIFSSGASNIMNIRSPYDVISLGFIFGLNEIQTKNAVSYSCRKLLLNSVGRRHGKAVMFVESVGQDSVINLDSENDEEPVLKKCKK